MLEKTNDFKCVFENIKKDIKKTRFRIIENANNELINLYFRLGKIIDDNWKYGNNFVNELSIELKLEFPDMKGLSPRNLRRMRTFYNEYKNIENWPMTLANLPWSHNTLIYQIESNLYQRQKENPKVTNFNKRMPITQSELAKNIIKDPYIFELVNLKENAVEREIENAMLSRIKNLLLEFGKGFSFVGNQYKISTNKEDYFIDLLFYHLELRCYVVVELKNTNFKPEYIGQLNFYVTAINKKLKKEYDNDTIGLLLCKNKDKLSVEWSLESTNNPIGVSSYKIKHILNKLPTEEDINMHIDI